MNWKEKLGKSERSHVYYATKGINTLAAFKASRAEKLKLEPVYGCCLDCWRIANKLGIEKSIPAPVINISEVK